MKLLRHDSSRLGCAATQSPTSRLPSTQAPVVDYDGGLLVALLGAARARRPALTAGLLASGQALFSGSLYVVAGEGSREIVAAKTAPIGGGLLILGWLSFVL